MQLALAQAGAAAAADEVPVGAVVVRDGQVIAVGRNAPIQHHDPTAHAEIVALRAAAQALRNYRLDGCTLYVTLEPCAMCSGAMLHARLAAVVYGAADPRTGAAGSVIDLFADNRLNHHTQVRGGVLAEACGRALQDFFQSRRARQQQMAIALREDALRTPDHAFASLPPSGGQSHYRTDGRALAGLRMHWIDSGLPERAGQGAATAGASAGKTWLFLHGAAHGSGPFDALAREIAAQGARVLLPDLIGFGRSDKPKREDFHTPERHRAILAEWARSIGLGPVVLVTGAGEDRLAQAVAPALEPWIVGWWRLPRADGPHPHDAAAYPDRGHRAGPRAMARWPTHVPAAPLQECRILVEADSPTPPATVALRVRRAMEYFGA